MCAAVCSVCLFVFLCVCGMIIVRPVPAAPGHYVDERDFAAIFVFVMIYSIENAICAPCSLPTCVARNFFSLSFFPSILFIYCLFRAAYPFYP
jgi:hypothetical protein